jgi:hypothetical protein
VLTRARRTETHLVSEKVDEALGAVAVGPKASLDGSGGPSVGFVLARRGESAVRSAGIRVSVGRRVEVISMRSRLHSRIRFPLLLRQSLFAFDLAQELAVRPIEHAGCQTLKRETFLLLQTPTGSVEESMLKVTAVMLRCIPLTLRCWSRPAASFAG